MQPTLTTIAIGAVVVPVVSLAAVWVARRIGRWLMRALTRSFAETVVNVMAPDMAQLRTRLGTSIDELRVSNSVDHSKVQGRLAEVESRLVTVEQRLAGVEARLPKEHP